MEQSEQATGYAEHRSSVEIKENSKGEVQISVKVYTGEDPDEMDMISTLAFDTFMKVKEKFENKKDRVKKISAAKPE